MISVRLFSKIVSLFFSISFSFSFFCFFFCFCFCFCFRCGNEKEGGSSRDAFTQKVVAMSDTALMFFTFSFFRFFKKMCFFCFFHFLYSLLYSFLVILFFSPSFLQFFGWDSSFLENLDSFHHFAEFFGVHLFRSAAIR